MSSTSEKQNFVVQTILFGHPRVSESRQYLSAFCNFNEKYCWFNPTEGLQIILNASFVELFS